MNNSDYIRIISIDPGTTTLGITVMDYQIYTNEFHLHLCRTVHVELVAKLNFAHVINFNGERAAKLQAIEFLFERYFDAWNPDVVICESPYLNVRQVSAFSSLTECFTKIRSAAYRYASSLPFILIDPATIKNGVGVKGNSGDKELVKAAVLSRPNLINTAAIDLTLLDEHAIDSIAVGYAYANK